MNNWFSRIRSASLVAVEGPRGSGANKPLTPLAIAEVTLTMMLNTGRSVNQPLRWYGNVAYAMGDCLWDWFVLRVLGDQLAADFSEVVASG